MLKTDTDSLLYHIFTNDLYEDLASNPLLQEHIEFSNYPETHPLYNNTRNKMVGLFQDECVDGTLTIISEYVGLRAKCYSSKLYNTKTLKYEEKKKCKGISKCHVKKRLQFQDYKNTLINNEPHEVKDIYSFRSKKLIQQTVCQNKKAFDNSDDKRIPINGSYKTYAHGHYNTCKK